MKRTDVINYIIQEKGYKTYLEIGIQNEDQNFNHINIDDKIGVDPAFESAKVQKKTSDQFFQSNTKKFDCIFIDGLHTFDQSTKDFNNALSALNEGGCILMHDVLPHNEQYTQPDWCGEVWKTAVSISGKYATKTFDHDHGVLVVFPEFKILDPSKWFKLFDTSKSYMEVYPGIDKLKSFINAVKNLSEVIPPTKEEIIEESPFMVDITSWDVGDVIEEATTSEVDMNTLTDEEIKNLHFEVFGTKPKGRFVRENVIAKIDNA